MSKPLKVTIYQDSSYEWRYRVRAGNGRQTLEPGEGYKTKRGCIQAVKRLMYWADDSSLADACGAALEANER